MGCDVSCCRFKLTRGRGVQCVISLGQTQDMNGVHLLGEDNFLQELTDLTQLFELLQNIPQIIWLFNQTAPHSMIHFLTFGSSKSHKQSWSASTNYLLSDHPLQCAALYPGQVIGYFATIHVGVTLQQEKRHSGQKVCSFVSNRVRWLICSF